MSLLETFGSFFLSQFFMFINVTDERSDFDLKLVFSIKLFFIFM